MELSLRASPGAASPSRLIVFSVRVILGVTLYCVAVLLHVWGQQLLSTRWIRYVPVQFDQNVLIRVVRAQRKGQSLCVYH